MDSLAEAVRRQRHGLCNGSGRMVRRSHALALALSVGFGALSIASSPAAAQRRGERPTSAGRVTAIRHESDRLTRALRRGSAQERRDALEQLEPDVRRILGVIERVQASGSVDPVAEHRAVAAAGRVLYAASEARPGAVSSELVDRFDTLYSRAAYRRVAPHHQTAVEIETRMSDRILDAMTTRDGTLGPLLEEGGKKPPRFLRRMARGGDVRDIQWDALSRRQKLQLLRSQSRGRSFFDGRSIPGMRFRRAINKPIGSAVALGGRIARVGEPTASVDGVLMDKVEYMGPKNVNKVSGIELHVRQPGRASRNARDAFTVVDLVGSPATQGHEHIPYRIPRAVMKGDRLARESLVDFYRRANMVGELLSVLEGYRLSPVRDGPVTYFDFLQADSLGALDQHLDSIARGRGGELGESSLKMGAVGFRTGELYGDPAMFGFEVRVLSKRRAQRGDRFVDALQKGVLTGRYGLARSRIEAWQRRALDPAVLGHPPTIADESRALARLHYNRPIEAALADAPNDLRDALTPRVEKRLRREAETSYGLKMLVHDWSADPALAGNRRAIDRVRQAQRKALSALERGAADAVVVGNFVKESNLYQVFAESIGMNDRSVQR